MTPRNLKFPWMTPIQSSIIWELWSASIVYLIQFDVFCDSLYVSFIVTILWEIGLFYIEKNFGVLK